MTTNQDEDMKKEEAIEKITKLKDRFHELTVELKEISPDSPSYKTIWDDRAEIQWEINEIKKQYNLS